MSKPQASASACVTCEQLTMRMFDVWLAQSRRLITMTGHKWIKKLITTQITYCTAQGLS